MKPRKFIKWFLICAVAFPVGMAALFVFLKWPSLVFGPSADAYTVGWIFFVFAALVAGAKSMEPDE